MMSLGLLLSAFGTIMGLLLVVMRLFLTNIEPGFTSLAAIGLFAFGVQLICLGVVGFYVGKIFKEVQNRPLYIIKDRFWR
jgi:dolichol-phosphate mannosyltransferase